MIIGIAGLGIVGSALATYLECDKHVIKKYDPEKGYSDSLSDCDFVFICVSAPTSSTQGSWPVDVSNIREVLTLFGKHPKYFIRSTVTPGTTAMLRAEFGNTRLIYSMPEFVSEKTALEDMAKLPIITDFSDMVSLGGIFCKDPILWQRIRIANHATECEIAKYAHNVFGALKVTFFNVVAGVCEYEGVPYDFVKDHVLSIGHMDKWYTNVPGPDGMRGFGGTCFPKDTLAFLNYLIGVENKTLDFRQGSEFISEILNYNDKVRGT